jgi:hypothetical protein
MGHMNESPFVFLMEFLEFHAHTCAQLRIQIAQRFVQKKNAGSAHQGPAHGNPLSLTPGEFFRLPLQQRRNAQESGRFSDSRFDAVFPDAAHAKGETQIFGHGHVRVEGIALKDHGHITVPGRFSVDGAAVYAHRSFILRHESRNDLEQCAFSTSRRPQKDAEFAAFHRKIDIPCGHHIPETFADVFEFKRCHSLPLNGAGREACDDAFLKKEDQDDQRQGGQ